MDKAEKLKLIKDKVSDSYQYFEQNYENYHYFTRFTFDTSIDSKFDYSSSAKDRPELEVNFCESFVSQALNYYFDQSPSLQVMSENMGDSDQVKVVEGIIRSILEEAKINRVLYEGAREALSGGFSVFHVTTDYKNPYSMEQVIRLEKAFDPTLTYFDKKASLCSKSDAEYAGILYLIPVDEFLTRFKDKVSKDSIRDMKFNAKIDSPDGRLYGMSGSARISGFQWSYSGGKNDFVLLARHYQKKLIKKKLVLLGGDPEYDGVSMLRSEYNDLLENWEYSHPLGEPQPEVIRERDTFITEVESTLLYENGILEEKILPYPDIPLVYVDGNSVLIRKKGSGGVRQMTRPLIYHLTGLQLLRNVATSTLANEMENLQMSQLMVPKEALPQEENFLDSYRDPQTADSIVYNAFTNDGRPIPPPSPVPRQQTPPTIMDAFHSLDQAKAVLGNYQHEMSDPSRGLSGAAIYAGARQSNASLAPYFYNFVEGALAQIARLCARMIPIYYDTARTVKVVSPTGEMSYEMINSEGAPSMDYDRHGLDVKIKPGPSNSLQRQESLQTMMGLAKSFPYLARFFGETQEGLRLILENIEVKGIDSVKEAISPFISKIEQQNQLNMQKQQVEVAQSQRMLKAQDPTLLKEKEIQLKAQTEMMNAELKKMQIELDRIRSAAKIAVDKQNADSRQTDAITDRMEAIASTGIDAQKVMLEGRKITAEERRAEVDALKASERLIKESSKREI